MVQTRRVPTLTAPGAAVLGAPGGRAGGDSLGSCGRGGTSRDAMSSHGDESSSEDMTSHDVISSRHDRSSHDDMS